MKRFLRYFLYRELYRALRSTSKDQQSRPHPKSVQETITELDAERLPASGQSFVSEDQVLAALQQMDPYAFEHLVADLWEEMGWTTEVPSQSADRGVDVIAKKSVPYDQTTLIQAKRYGPNTTVGSPEIQQYASLRHQYQGVDKVVMVTTNTYTQQAHELANKLNVKLVDGQTLVDLIIAYEAADLLAKHVSFINSSDDERETDHNDVDEPHFDDGPDRFDASTTAPTSADDNTDQTTVTSQPDPWFYYGVITATALWILYLPLGGFAEEVTISLLGIPAWILLPLCLYLDTEAFEESWLRYRWAYLAISLIPVIAVISGILYLWKRSRLTTVEEGS